VDATVGSNPSLAMELYRPIGSTPLFVAPHVVAGTATLNIIQDDAVIARYKQKVTRGAAMVGINLGARSDLRTGVYVGRTTASIEVGDPGFPELRGKETGAEMVWRLDTQDSSIVPSGGVLSQVRLSRIFDTADLRIGGETVDFDATLTQLSAFANGFWSLGRTERELIRRQGGVIERGADAAMRYAVQPRRIQRR
jgi:NTE family protein